MERLMFGLAVIASVTLGGLVYVTTREGDQTQYPPVLVTEQDAVKLYRVYDTKGHKTVYFTVPHGQTMWEEQQGKQRIQNKVN